MHVKAFGLMTRHPVKLEALPEDLRDAMPVDERGRVDRPPRELRAEVFRRFSRALEPLRRARQARRDPAPVPVRTSSTSRPRSTTSSGRPTSSPGDELLVEFRHRSWLDEENRAQTLSFLESRGLTYVIVDAPKTEAKNLVPTVVARTSTTAYVRFHGRNAATWNKRTGSAAERFDYLYSEQELEEWVRAAARARARRRVRLRDVQQQRPLRDAVDRPRGARAGGGRGRPGEGRGGPGAGERADAAPRCCEAAGVPVS